MALAVLLASASLVAAAPSLVARQAITPLTTAEIDVFTPYTYYAAAGYCTPATTLAWNCGTNCEANPDFEPVAAGGDGNSVQYWYVGWDPKLETVIVAHQGTNTSQLLPVLTDASFVLESLNATLFPGVSSSVKAHSGFANEQAKTATTILSAVQTAISKYGAKNVTLVGHSLGAALALLDSVYLPLHVSGVTFSTVTYGMPRVGNLDFADLASDRPISHINNKWVLLWLLLIDPVPTLPYQFMGYVHPTGEIHIEDSGAWDNCPGMDNPSTLCSTGDVPTLLNGNVNDHDGPYNGVEITCS
uniref:Fungal lipase-type domain-containing protein n=1 Tax=Mycena chlorophos TaxID=658473 RepID=A0ABQ0LQT0_MYCCL|nr:predicted protein [Mycena chlorophos]